MITAGEYRQEKDALYKDIQTSKLALEEKQVVYEHLLKRIAELEKQEGKEFKKNDKHNTVSSSASTKVA